MKKTGMLLMFGIMTVFLAGCQGRNQDAEEEKEEIGRASCRERV